MPTFQSIRIRDVNENRDTPDREKMEPHNRADEWTPVQKLDAEYVRVMKATQEELDLEPGVYIHEGSELMSQLRDDLMMLPDLSQRYARLRRILERHFKLFLGDGNAAPAPARGVVCDIDVRGAKPIVFRPRSIIPKVAMKVYELLKKLLETGLIEISDSAWASPIVIVLKKNGIDVRLHRVIELSVALIDNLLVGFERTMWFMSLDMASGFWTIHMTKRAKRLSAFVCSFGRFQ
ncbi:LOW QUALITY PROTEIN: hypothetical protein PHMEG_00023005 [Phytophthora megakarya]|uniref:Reverse transcriptase n=1 Tax=Phytophthora megakarya TaxID=4795 RepID=A0A225VHD1_9STRA|nr:LOW QUALITY PROTEIN: hypothetical protein PHMEG_00023005 [Phytophthora megakarya]